MSRKQMLLQLHNLCAELRQIQAQAKKTKKMKKIKKPKKNGKTKEKPVIWQYWRQTQGFTATAAAAGCC